MSRNNDDVPVPGASRASSSKSAQAIWDQRVLGFSVHEISQQTGLSVEKVGELLESYHRSIKPQGIEFHRQLALSRIEALLKVYLPQALSDSVTIERIRAGEPVAEEDVEYPLRCAVFCLAALKFGGELLNLRAVPEPVGGANRLSVLDWLATQRAFVKKAAEEAPSDTLELPSQQRDPGPVEDPAIARSESDKPEIEFAEIDIRRQDSQAPPQKDALSQAGLGAALDDLDDVREMPFAERKVIAPPDPQVQEIDRAERRQRFFAGQPDGL